MMFKALLKKQLMETFSFLFMSRRTGKTKTRSGMIGYAVYFIAIMVFVGYMMYIFVGSFAETLLAIPSGILDWFYFAMVGIMAVVIGAFASLFSAMSALYKSKDNELLISMPIPPWIILTVRMIAIYVMSIFYSLIVWIPGVVRYMQVRGLEAKTLICCVILELLIGLLVTVLSCAAGWVVALISGKLRNKSFITVIISLAIFAIYYYFILRINTILASIVAQTDAISRSVRSFAYPFYVLGMAATGNVVSLLIFAAIVIALFALCCFILSRTFIRIATTNKGDKKAVYREKKTAAKSVFGALFAKEMKRFTNSATYMLNCGLGLVLLPAAAIIALIYKDLIREYLPRIIEDPKYLQMVPVLVCAFVCVVSVVNMISAPSISLEGKGIWILQSLPVRTIDVFHAKEALHFVLNIIPAVFGLLVLAYVFQISVPLTLLMLVTVILFTAFSAGFGLISNLKHPNLSWTNETVPIKQGAASLITLFAGWAFCFAGGGAYFFLLSFIGPAVWIAIICAVLVVVIIWNERWMRNKGARIFEEL